MRNIGDQSTRATGARGPFTPVRTRLDIDLIGSRDFRLTRERRKNDDRLTACRRACVPAIVILALCTLGYLVMRSV